MRDAVCAQEEFKNLPCPVSWRHDRRRLIGAAFGSIVGAFVSDAPMPLFGPARGGINIRTLFGNHECDSRGRGASLLSYDLFMNMLTGFLIIAFTLFIAIQGPSIGNGERVR